jgi:hypothetical protein
MLKVNLNYRRVNERGHSNQLEWGSDYTAATSKSVAFVIVKAYEYGIIREANADRPHKP